ncbi:MAG TPA: hypothetical protein PKJ47_13360, partial [Candidatus Limiplasma sp.]|nr:hypothetical protein [Candidatus Limiplasma sp.]
TGTDTERVTTEPFAPALTVEKTVTSTQPADGYALDDVIAYSIVVTNSGNETVTGITLSDALMGAPVTIGTLAPGASAAVVKYTYKVTVADILAGGVANTATATGKDGNNNNVTATDTETATTEPPSPELSITKTTAQTEVRAGEDIAYVITVTNSGLADATGVKVTENLPTNATFKSAATASGSYNSGTGLWDLGNLAVGGTATLTLVLTANANVADGDTIVNIVTITEENGVTPENPPTGETEIPVKNPNLKITKTTSQSWVRAGEDISYVITVKNDGSGDAKGVKVTEHLPSNATFWGASTATGTYSLITNVWTVGDLAAGQTATLIISLTVNDDVTDGETVVNAVEITEENGETLANPPTDETDTLVKMPVLVIKKSTSQTQVQAGEDITYIITVTNNGHSEASGVVVTETLPTNATYKSHTASAGVFDTQTAKWTIDTVAAEGGFETLTLTLTINGNAQEGQAINHVVITEVDGNSNPNEPEDTVVTPILNPALRIVKSASVPGGSTLASAGGKLTYQIQIFNDGQAEARDLMITDLVPAQCTFVSASCPEATSVSFDNAANTLRCEIAELAAGQNATVAMTVNVNAWSQIGTRTIHNTAKLYFQNATLDSNTVQHLQTNTDSSDVPVTGENENVLIILLMMAALLALVGTLTWLACTRPRRNK